MGYCTKGQSVNVKITAPNNSIQHFATAPIDINESGSDSSGNMCWRFQQLTNGVVTNQYFGCGKSGYFQYSQQANLQPNVAQYNLYIDGNLILSPVFWYATGTNSAGTVLECEVTTVDEVVLVAGDESIGGCDCLGGGCCTLTMTDDNSGNQVFNHTYPVTCDKVTYQVTCDGCLPGQLQCICDNYPGYCCVDCAGVESRIESLTQQVKQLNANYG